VAKQKFLFSLRKSFPSNPVISSDEVLGKKILYPVRFFNARVVFEEGERKNPPTGGGVNHEINCLFRFLQYYFQNA